ncbi:MAG: HEPN domain-containing protein [Ignavibacteriales bacterium]|nr:HEPN domain-containing protein [Ignavibacteriales bacterium]
MTQESHRVEVVRYWWKKGKESLESAKRERDAGFYSFASNRIYYAAFYAVSALLLDREFTFKKHSGVRNAFHQKFIKHGLIDKEWGKFYDRLFEDRQEGDYLALTEFEREYIDKQIDKCSEFLELIMPHFVHLIRE